MRQPLPGLPIEEIARYPLPGMNIPGEPAFSPDDRLVTYLHSPEGGLARRLYAFDPQTGRTRLLTDAPGGGTSEQNVSLEEALRRERARQRETGITHYAWSPDGQSVLLPSQGDLWLGEAAAGQAGLALRRLAQGGAQPCLDGRFSPDGAWVAYVQGGELYAVPRAGGEPRRLTYDGGDCGCTNGLAEYIAQEEMGRREGYWWSPDSRALAFAQVDERHIPVYRILHQGKSVTGEAAQEDHHYPFAGQANAVVRLGVVRLAADGSPLGEPAWMDLGPQADGYLARVHWLPDGRLAAQVLDRAQRRLELRICDPDGGASRVLLSESSPVWINLNNLFCALDGSRAGQFLWGAERDGFRHLYLYGGDGQLLRRLTHGEWMVDDLCGVDLVDGWVYFTATRHDPRQKHLYRAALEGGEPQRITQAAGIHEVTLDYACRRFIDLHHALNRPPQVTLRALDDGRTLAQIASPHDPRLAALDLEPPELVSLANRHGDLLYGALYRPPAAFGPGPHPLLVDVYGGPHAQHVSDSWLLTVAMRRQYLRRLGFLVFVLDNRGTARRGLAFEAAIQGRLGGPEVDDQVDGVRWLVAQGLADPLRVGIYGWSYGGYMALMCLARAPETFQVGVAGAPVTAWDGYDTHYTERYMGLPQEHPQAYRESSVLEHVAGLRGRLMLVHGLIDENVHFRHTARLINALIAARKSYDLLLFPDERHMPRGEADRIYMEERLRDFFVKNL